MIKKINTWLNSKPLFVKLNVSILTCVSLVFLFLVVYITQKAKPTINYQIESIAEKSLEAYSFDLSHLVKDTEQTVINIKNTLNYFKENNLNSIKVVLNSAIKTVYHSELNFVNAWVYTFSSKDATKGNLYISTHTDDATDNFKHVYIDNFYKNFFWLNEIPQQDTIFWSEPYFDPNSKLMVVTCLIPFNFINNSEFNGLVALTVNLSNIQNSISSYSFYETGKLLLLSRSGLYITHPDSNIALKTTVYDLAKKLNLPDLSRAGKEVFAGKQGKFEVPYSSMFNSPTIYFYSPIKNINWGMFLVYEKKEFYKPIYLFNLLISLSLLAGVILISVFVYSICKNSTNQLLKLGEIAIKYGKGNFSHNFTEEPSSKDIGVLSKALSFMKLNILDYIEKEKNDAIEKQKNISELDIAYQIQQSALSNKYPNHEAFKISTLMIPAKQIGGDFYDFFFIDDNKFAIVIADVAGKGMPAALYMMKTQALIKNIAKNTPNISDVFYRVNNELYEGNDTCMFVTAFLAVIDLVSGNVEYINAGHNHPLIKDNGVYRFINPNTNIVLGINKNAKFVSETVKLKPDDRIFLYTDGVTEAENKRCQFYGKNRLEKFLQNSSGNNTLNLLLKDIQKFEKGTSQSDDITLLEFIYKGFTPGKLSIGANIKNLGKVIEFCKSDMKKYYISEDIQFKAVMIAEEIFSNISQYAYKKPNFGKIQIQTEIRNDRYFITFIDKGIEYNLLDKQGPNIDLDFSQKEIGGLGIHLIKKLADDITYTRQNNYNILKIGLIIPYKK